MYVSDKFYKWLMQNKIVCWCMQKNKKIDQYCRTHSNHKSCAAIITWFLSLSLTSTLYIYYKLKYVILDFYI